MHQAAFSPPETGSIRPDCEYSETLRPLTRPRSIQKMNRLSIFQYNQYLLIIQLFFLTK